MSKATIAWKKNTFALLVDSGATKHMVRSTQFLTEYKAFDKPMEVEMGDGWCVHAEGVGTLTFVSNSCICEFPGTLYVPELTCNALSVSYLTENDYKVVFTKFSAQIFHMNSELPLLTAKKSDGLFLIDMNRKQNTNVCLDKTASIHTVLLSSTTAPEPADLWHARLGHISKTTLSYMAKHDVVDGLPDIQHLSCVYDQPCQHCLAGSFPAFPHSEAHEKPDAPLSIIYADINQGLKPAYDGSTDCLTVVDSYSGYVMCVPLKSKKDIPVAIKNCVERYQMLAGCKVRELRTDCEPIFHSEVLRSWLAKQCINLSHSAPFIHQQVGLVERANRTMTEMARSLLSHAGRPGNLWPEAFDTAAYLYNRRASSALDAKATRYELLTKRRPSISNLKVWGCVAYARQVDPDNKLQSRCQKGVFVGYDEFSNAYKFMINRTIYIRSDIIFSENELGNIRDPSFDKPTCTAPVSEPPIHSDIASTSADPVHPDTATTSATPVHTKKRSHDQIYTPTSGALAVKARRAEQAIHVLSNKPSIPLPTDPEPFIPQTYEEAVNDKYAEYWLSAMEDEHQSMIDNDVYELVDLPPKKVPLSSKWVYTWKTDASNKIVKSKARIVAKGYLQQPGEDYDELFSPTIAQATLRTMLAKVAAEDLFVRQIDFKTAFLNGSLEEVLYMVPPTGYTNGNKVWLLKKSLYGLKQAPRQWYLKLSETLATFNFEQSCNDRALFLRTESDGTVTYLTVHVDDMLIINKNKSATDTVIDQLNSVLKITDLGEAHRYLKIDIVKKSSQVFIHQTNYTLSLVKKYINLDRVVASTPLPPGTSTCKVDSIFAQGDSTVPYDATEYSSLIGSLLYLANGTRPDIAFSVNNLARYMSCPSLKHFHLAQHIIAYLNSTYDFGILYKSDPENPILYGMADASFCSDLDTSRSVTGYCFMWHSGVVSYQSKLQPTVALSTAESEYMSISSAGREGICLQRLTREVSPVFSPGLHIGVGAHPHSMELVVEGKQPEQIAAGQLIYSDSESAIKMIQDVESVKKTRHISAIHHWAREQVQMKQLVFEYVKGRNNIADIFTKALPQDKFTRMREKLGVMSLSDL